MAVEQVIKISLDDLKALGGIDNLKKSLGDTEASTKSLKQQLKEATAEVAQMAEKYGEASKETVQAAKRAAELKDRIEDANDAIMAFKGEGAFLATGKALQSVASGFAAAQGAMGLFGSESENVEKAILKVQSAMALAQGLEGLEDAGRAFTQLKTVAVNAFNAIKGAIGGLGIGALVIALGAVVVYWDDIKNALFKVNKEQEIYNSLQSETIKNSSQEISSLDTLYKASQNHKLSIEDRKAAIDKLQEKYPQYFKNIDDEAFLNGKAANSYYELRKAIIEVAKAKAAQGKIDEISQGYLEEELAIKKRMEQANLDYRNAKDTTVFLQGSGMFGGGTYQQVSKAENQASAKARFDQETENLKKLYIDRNNKLQPYVNIVGSSLSTEQSFSKPTNNSKPSIPSKPKGSEFSNEQLIDIENGKKIEEIKLQTIKDADVMRINLAKESEHALTNIIAEEAEKRKLIEDEQAELRKARLMETANVMGQVSELIGKDTIAGKALAISQAIINTYLGASEALKQKSTLPSPFDVVAKVANVATIIATGLKTVKAISSVKVGARGGGGGSAPSMGGLSTTVQQPQFNVAGDAGVNQIASTLANQKPIKAYVVGKEVSTQQSLDRNIVKNATLG